MCRLSLIYIKDTRLQFVFSNVSFVLSIGETLKIVVEDYSNHLTNFNFPLFFKPELLFGQDFQYQNRISLEFNHVYHWHPLVPDEFNISGTIYNMKEFLYHPEIVVKHGMRDFVDSMIKQRAGLVINFPSFYFHSLFSFSSCKHYCISISKLSFLTYHRLKFAIISYVQSGKDPIKFKICPRNIQVKKILKIFFKRSWKNILSIPLHVIFFWGGGDYDLQRNLSVILVPLHFLEGFFGYGLANWF